MIINSPGVNYDTNTMRTDDEIKAVIGDVPKIAFGSYAGTGTYGASNPCEITFDFAPKFIWVYGYSQNTMWTKSFTQLQGEYGVYIIETALLTTDYKTNYGLTTDYRNNIPSAKKSSDGKTVYWYNAYNSTAQCNNTDRTYHWVAIG